MPVDLTHNIDDSATVKWLAVDEFIEHEDANDAACNYWPGIFEEVA